MSPDVSNADPARLLELHGAMLSSAQDDVRARRAWEEGNSARVGRLREELREDWLAHHRLMEQRLYAQLAEEHAAKAAALLGEGAA